MITTLRPAPTTARSGAEIPNLLNPIPRLLELLQGATGEQRWLDAYLVAAGVQQILDDALHPDRLRLRQAAAALRRRQGRRLRWAAAVTTGASGLAWTVGSRLSATARLLEARDGVAELVRNLAEVVMEPRDGSEKVAAGCARVDALLRGLSGGVTKEPLRLPACFRTFDQAPDDLRGLAGMVAQRWPRQPLVVIGVRTSGSYLAPLLAAAVRRCRGVPATVLTTRPGHPWLREESGLLRSLAGAGGVALVIDDPPRSWRSVARAAGELCRLGFPAHRVGLALQTLPSTAAPPEVLAPHPALLLPWRQWAVHGRLSPAAVGEALRRLAGSPQWVTDVVRIPLETDAGEERGHVRALYRVETLEEGVRGTHLIYVKGVGLGYLGRHSCAVARPLSPFLPRVYGVDGGLLFREWLPENERLAPDVATPAVADRIADYVDRRAHSLAVDHDPTFDLGARGSTPGEAALLLSRAAGRADLLLRPLAERLTRQLLTAGRPAVVDGHTALDAWFGDPESPVGMRKVGFDERAFSSLDLTCFDPVFDLAGASCGDEPPWFGERLREAYTERSGERVDAERWLLYRLVHLQDRLRHSGEPRSVIERRMSRCVLRYLEERVVGSATPQLAGRLCAFDVDGVLESTRFGFSASTPGAVNGLRALLLHGYRPVLASGRSLGEIRDRCDAYHLSGGVAEYGAALYVRGESRARVLAGEEELAALDRVRHHLEGTAGLTIDPAYRYSVRAHASGRSGSGRALPREVVVEALEAAGRGLVREVRGRLQTDFVAAGVSKEAALRALGQELGADGRRPALAMGDTENDLGMLRLAERSLAPSNADRALRDQGIPVLRQPAQRAVAEGVRRLLGHAPGGCPVCACLPREPRSDLLLQVLDLAEGGRSRTLGRLFRLLMTPGV